MFENCSKSHISKKKKRGFETFLLTLLHLQSCRFACFNWSLVKTHLGWNKSSTPPIQFISKASFCVAKIWSGKALRYKFKAPAPEQVDKARLHSKNTTISIFIFEYFTESFSNQQTRSLIIFLSVEGLSGWQQQQLKHSSSGGLFSMRCLQYQRLQQIDKIWTFFAKNM